MIIWWITLSTNIHGWTAIVGKNCNCIPEVDVHSEPAINTHPVATVFSYAPASNSLSPIQSNSSQIETTLGMLL